MIHFISPIAHDNRFNINISDIDPSRRYKNYYIITTEMIFGLHTGPGYEADELMRLLDLVITNKSIITELQNGVSLLLFDFGSETIPLAIDDSSLYGIINKRFHDLQCSTNVKYWTMYSNPYDIIDKEQCNVEIIPVSITSIQYDDFNYNDYIIATENNSIPSKSVLYLNRRVRQHRLKLLVECVRNNLEIDDTYFSFIGHSAIDVVNYPKYYQQDMISFLSTHVNNEPISEDTFKTIVNDCYGKHLLLTDNEITEWLGASTIERVVELLNHRAKSKFEVVTEYSFEENGGVNISEKLTLALLSKIPFVILGDKGFLRELRQLGFQTFDAFWDESYDTMEGDDRIVALAKRITDIQQNFKCDVDEYGNSIYTDEMNNILEHNYNHYKDVFSPRVRRNIIRTLSHSEHKEPLCK